MAKSKQRATYADLLKLPDNVVGEIIDGELVATPRPTPGHSYGATVIAGELGPFNRPPGGSGGPGGWILMFEPELHLHGDVVVPDIAGWRRERMPQLPTTAQLELPPDWACEVLSRSTSRYDRFGKKRIYERERVNHYWIVDIANETLEVLRLTDGRLTEAAVFAGAEKARIEPFDAIEIDLARVWSPY
jgi:Uma2 family endonuclease